MHCPMLYICTLYICLVVAGTYYYTVGLFDVHDGDYSQSNLPYVHWLVTNALGANVTNSNEQAAYIPPFEPHR